MFYKISDYFHSFALIFIILVAWFIAYVLVKISKPLKKAPSYVFKQDEEKMSFIVRVKTDNAF
jgi:hypothetical protein